MIKWEKFAGSHNKHHKKIFKEGFYRYEINPLRIFFKVRWSWDGRMERVYEYNPSSEKEVLEFYEGIRIAIPASEWGKEAMLNNSRLRRTFLKERIKEIIKKYRRSL